MMPRNIHPLWSDGRGRGGGEDSGSIRAALAVDLYRYALMLQPADPDAWLALAHLHLAANTFADGPAERAGEAKSGQRSCEMGGQEVQNPEWAGPGHETGRGAQDSGRRAVNTVAAARAMMDMAVKLDPNHAPALLARGNLQRQAQHDLLGSRVSLLQALESLEKQRHPVAGVKRRAVCKVLTSLGLTAEAQEDVTEAEMRYRAALAAWGQDGSAALLLALLLHAQGRGEEAKAVLRGAVATSACKPPLSSAAPLCKAASSTHAAVHYNLALMIMEGYDISDAEVLESLQLLREAVRLAPTDLDMRAKLAWLLFVTDQDVEGAEEKLLEVLAVDPAHASGLVCVSRVMQERGRDLQLHLQPLLARAMELKPDDALLRREHARLLEMLDDLAGAQDELRRARALQPSDANTLLSLARLLAFSHTRPDADDETWTQELQMQEQEQEQGEQEGEELRSWCLARLRPSPAADPLCALSPDDAPEEDPEDHEDPEGVGRRAVEKRVPYSLQSTNPAHKDQGQAPVDFALQRAASDGQRMKRTVFQDLEEARQLLDEALILDPHCSEASIVRGHLLGGRHTALYEPQSAIASFRHALALSPGDVEALAALGDVLLRVGDVQEGLAAWQGAIDLAPRDADLRYNLACVLSTLQDPTAPNHTKHNPDRPLPLCDLDCALLAKNMWFSVLSLDPSHVQARYNLAMVAVAEEDDETAEEHMRAMLRQHPNHAPSLYQCARLVEKRGAVNEAISILDTLVNSNQRGLYFADAAARLARLLAQVGRIEEAHDLFQQLVETTVNKTSTMSRVQAAFASSSLVQYASFLHQFQDNVPRAIRVLQHALVQAKVPTCALELRRELDTASYLGYLQIISSDSTASPQFQEGMELLERALQDDPTHIESLWRYAKGLFRLSLFAKAREYVRRALSVDGNCEEAQDLDRTLALHLHDHADYDPLADIGEQVERGVSFASREHAADGGWVQNCDQDSKPDLQDRVFAGSQHPNLYRSGAPSLSVAQRDFKTTGVQSWRDLNKRTTKKVRNWDSAESESGTERRDSE